MDLLISIRGDVFSLQPLLPVGNGECHLLAVPKGCPATAIVAIGCSNRALVNKDLFTGRSNNETKTLGSIEPFDGAGFPITAGLGWPSGFLGFLTRGFGWLWRFASGSSNSQRQIALESKDECGEDQQRDVTGWPESARKLNGDCRKQKGACCDDEKSPHDITRKKSAASYPNGWHVD